MDYKSMKIDDIIAWCIAHNQVAWLKATAAQTFTQTITKEDGTTEAKERKITFIELKLAFVEKFMPEIAPERKPKQPSMFDKIAAL